MFLALQEILLWALRKRRPWRVSGPSMEPAFRDGDLVLIDPRGLVRAGDAIVVRHPFKNLDIIKYVESVDDDNHLRLRSPAGDDSRQFGRVPTQTVKGRVTFNWHATRRDT